MIRIHLEQTINTHELISLSCNNIMPPKKRNQIAGKTLILQMNTATFQVAVTASITAVMTHLNANNANGSGILIGNPNLVDNQVQKRVPTRNDTLNLQMKNKKWMYLDKKKGKSPQKLAKRQQSVAASATTTSVTPIIVSTSIPVTHTPLRQYAGNLPKCKKCSFHHLGVYQMIHYKNCNRNRHTTHFCRVLIQHITSTAKVGITPICHLCGEI